MNIYVSNLSFNTGDVELNELFSGFGEVISAKVIMDKETGRSRGFGFVEMQNESEGQEAIAKLQDKVIVGRAMNVSVAKEKKPASGGYGAKRW